MAGGQHLFRLYIAGTAPSSARAVMSLRRFCAEHLGSRAAIEVIDVTERPDLARAAKVIAVPTLVATTAGGGERRLVGDLSRMAEVVLPRGASAP